MASAVQYAVLLMSLTLAVHNCGGISQKTRCVSQPTCFDLLTFEKIVQRIRKDTPAADKENILLKSRTFDKIRKQKYLHSCVLRKIIDFYENVLNQTQDNSNDHYYISPQGVDFHLQLISIMNKLRNCTYKMNRRCETLYQKAAQQPKLEI
ncbi:uncharacterized protein si:ch211-266a5.12 [Astyanax mexicanus]|uniref:uncharacterized protein si:ch211-266a5.12 n=1 Tax=Astyanax mexicanus TaxID=7994 RepID=UPI0020CAE1D3|nr:uncharacterized protein si:ch211-266a5.12 [Astyanax mexicanus]